MASYPDRASGSLPLPVSPRSSVVQVQASAAFTKATPIGAKQAMKQGALGAVQLL
jgi:hypothetical protein